MRRVTAYCANLFDDLEVQCNVGRRAALDVNYSNHGAGGTGPLARSFHSQSIIAKLGDGRAHIDRRATVITFVETDRWITKSSGNVGVQLCLAVALKELQPSCGRRAPPDRQAFDNFGGMHSRDVALRNSGYGSSGGIDCRRKLKGWRQNLD